MKTHPRSNYENPERHGLPDDAVVSGFIDHLARLIAREHVISAANDAQNSANQPIVKSKPAARKANRT